MAKIYAARIKDGKMTLEEVPKRWQDETKSLIEDGE